MHSGAGTSASKSFPFFVEQFCQRLITLNPVEWRAKTPALPDFSCFTGGAQAHEVCCSEAEGKEERKRQTKLTLDLVRAPKNQRYSPHHIPAEFEPNHGFVCANFAVC